MGDLHCCFGFLLGLLFKLCAKEEPGNGEHQDAQECREQNQRRPSNGLFLLSAQFSHEPAKNLTKVYQDELFAAITENVVLCAQLKRASPLVGGLSP